MKESLKPCPFCGGEAELQYGACDYNVWQVICKSQQCNGMAGWDDDPQRATDTWNKRKENEK